MVKVVWLFGGVNDCLGLCGLLWSMGNREACMALKLKYCGLPFKRL